MADAPLTVITTPSGDHRWIAKDAAEVAHFSQPGQGHKIEVYTLAESPQPPAAPLTPLSEGQVIALLLHLNGDCSNAASPTEMFTIIVRAVEKLHGITTHKDAP